MRFEKPLSKERSESGISSQPNLLISEKSPYLLQHAYNPVDWHPWSEHAFELAKREDKPVFLSIGYSTCHWCHVMARESFEDISVAKLLNDAFICIKVDREERPDIDQIYMAACQAMTGSGGWPLTIVMTSDKKPFFAATYIPKRSRFGSMGMLELIPKIKDLWINSRQKLLESSDNIIAHLVEASSSKHGTAVDQTVLERAYQELVDLFDPQNGGFGSAPKFPTPHNLFFLLRYWSRTKNTYALEMVEITLEAMRMGGIYDHLGFGFHRYSTDASWLVPHFEKMLYDQALLALAYLEAYQATRKELYARAAQEILTYVLRDMTSPQGGFYSAEDADSEGEEGRFYLWDADQLRALLDREQYSILSKVFNIREGGNFEKGMNILAMRSSLEDASSVIGMSQRDLEEKLNCIREKLFWAREKRIHPHKDDKILGDWNGLVIAALARASQILQRPDYAKAARSGADFILNVMLRPDGRLHHRYRDGSGISANLDDYSFLAWGLIELYEAVFEARYLQAAIDLSNSMIEHFWDNECGGFFFSPDDAEALPIRQKLIYDGALPSGNSVAMLNLLRLSYLTGNCRWHELADKINLAFSDIVTKHPAAYCMFLTSSELALGPVYQVAIVGDPSAQDTSAMLQTLRSRFLPNKAVLFIPIGQESTPIIKVAEYAKNFSAIDGKATAYVCASNACRLPTCSSAAMLELLGSHS